MQIISSEYNQSTDVEAMYFTEDFPTVEELWAALDASLEHPPWAARTTPIGLNNASRDLAKRWSEISNVIEPPPRPSPGNNDHYLVELDAGAFLNEVTSMEPEFMVDFARFLLQRLSHRIQEVRQVQHQLIAELAKLQA